MRKYLCASLCTLALLSACKEASSAVGGIKSAGSTVANGIGAVPSLVNVDLSNVLNDLALDLKIDKSNVPINAQIPISLAANVCGVSINILSLGGGGSSKGCTANTASPELVQAVQQQLAAQGSVGGGAQSNSGTPTPAPSPAGTTAPPTAPLIQPPAPSSPTPGPSPTATPSPAPSASPTPTTPRN